MEIFMTIRKVINLISGKLGQIQSGDYIDPTELGSGTPSGSTYLSGANTWGTLPFETSTSNIKKAGAVSVGSSVNIPRADHIHPVNAFGDLSDISAGTWTPTDASGAGLTLNVQGANYYKMGKLVYISAYIIYPTTLSSANAKIGGLPYAVNTGLAYPYGIGAISNNAGLHLIAEIAMSGSTQIYPTVLTTDAYTANSTLNGKYLLINCNYLTA
jgi:hypothetical protein